MGIGKILKAIGKNILAFILGGIFGIVILFIFFMGNILQKAGAEAGLGIIGLAPVLMLLYSVFAFFLGGILGIVVFNVCKIGRIFKKKAKARKV